MQVMDAVLSRSPPSPTSSTEYTGALPLRGDVGEGFSFDVAAADRDAIHGETLGPGRVSASLEHEPSPAILARADCARARDERTGETCPDSLSVGVVVVCHGEPGLRDDGGVVGALGTGGSGVRTDCVVQSAVPSVGRSPADGFVSALLPRAVRRPRGLEATRRGRARRRSLRWEATAGASIATRSLVGDADDAPGDQSPAPGSMCGGRPVQIESVGASSLGGGRR